MADEPNLTLYGFSIERTKIRTTDQVYRAAKAAGRLDHEYDTELSDMGGTTVIVEPDGTVVDPYAVDGQADLMALLKPLLLHVPTWRVEQYAMGRRSEEE